MNDLRTAKKKNKNIVLIGFMGSGKTSVGKRLSMILKREFIDMDDYIEKREQMTVNEIFAQKGEPYFREQERELCKRLANSYNKVVATGGGVVKSAENIAALKNSGIIFYLCSTPEKIAENLKNDSSRPLLNVPDKADKIRQMMKEREPFYKNAYDVEIDVSNSEIDKTVEYIINYTEREAEK